MPINLLVSSKSKLPVIKEVVAVVTAPDKALA